MAMKMSKRTFLGATGAAIGALFVGGAWRESEAATRETFEANKSPQQWRRQLPPRQYAVLREASTGRAASSPLDKEYRKRTYLCAGCDLPIYSSATKFDSGTGWPSFYAPIRGAVRTKPDN